jgi:hypothetical protein
LINTPSRLGRAVLAIDRNNEMVYVLPIASLPMARVHSKIVRVERNQLTANDTEIADCFWK